MRIRGRTYASAEQLLEEIEQLEQMRDAELDELRGRGAHAAADKRADAYERELNELRAGVRKYREREASSTEQPPDTPRRSRRQLAGAARRRAKRPSSRRLFGGRASSRILRETGARGAYVSTTRVLLELAGMVIGIALLINLLESERGAGNRYSGLDTFTGLLERGVDALGRFIGPVDPFTGVDVTTGRPAGAPAPAARTPSAARRRRPGRPAARPVTQPRTQTT